MTSLVPELDNPQHSELREHMDSDVSAKRRGTCTTFNLLTLINPPIVAKQIVKCQ